jgi:hypothetical protein
MGRSTVPKSTLEASEAEIRSAQGLVATCEVADPFGESWQIGVYALAFDEPVTTDVLHLVAPVAPDALTTTVAGLLDTVGLRLELPWRVVHDGYLMTRVHAAPPPPEPTSD